MAVISLSGVLMPGPVFAVTIACGFQDRWSGWKIALGHALVEIPTIVAIFFGLSVFIRNEMVLATIGLIGGAILLYMGYDVFRTRKEVVTSCSTKYQSPFWAGVMTTAANPGWLLWWATVGAALTATAVTFGWWMLPFFVVVHITCDLLWEGFVGMTIFETKGRWSSDWHQRVIAGSGVLMIFFALLFVYNALSSLL
ncbi:MAG: LysE type translocator [Methanomassiliicoccales archaeon PtaB.Bin134]|nr:MAG: LysE type translocator [Methanomassiliicoccales archaeon PtaB.Bin134]